MYWPECRSFFLTFDNRKKSKWLMTRLEINFEFCWIFMNFSVSFLFHVNSSSFAAVIDCFNYMKTEKIEIRKNENDNIKCVWLHVLQLLDKLPRLYIKKGAERRVFKWSVAQNFNWATVKCVEQSIIKATDKWTCIFFRCDVEKQWCASRKWMEVNWIRNLASMPSNLFNLNWMLSLKRN